MPDRALYSHYSNFVEHLRTYYFVITTFTSDGESIASNEEATNLRYIDRLIFKHKKQTATVDDERDRIRQYMEPQPESGLDN